MVSRRRSFKVLAVMVRLTAVKSLLENCAIDDCRIRLEGKDLAVESSESPLTCRKNALSLGAKTVAKDSKDETTLSEPTKTGLF